MFVVLFNFRKKKKKNVFLLRAGYRFFTPIPTLSLVRYKGPAKSFVTGFRLLQRYVLSNIFFITNLQSIPPLQKHIFVTFLPSREKLVNSLLLVSVGDTDK